MRIFVAFFVFFSAKVWGAVPMTVYYEALCPDSADFITRQLYPNYQFFKNYITLDFVPYGKALHSLNNKTGKYIFSCQHGQDECKGNKFHACGLKQIKDQDTKLEFVTCVMSSRNPSKGYIVERCARKYDLDFDKIRRCALSHEGDSLLARHGEKTWNLEPNIYFVPTVIFNNSETIDNTDQEKSLSNFKALFCSKIATDRPDICKDVGFFGKIKNFFS